MPSPLSPTDAPNHYWTAERNDIVGGWIVTNCKMPATTAFAMVLADEGDAYVIADCSQQADAIIIASVLNRAGVRRP